MNDTATILIADRNPHIRNFLRKELEAEGYRVVLAKDGRELLGLLGGNGPHDLLILDLDLPHISGIQVMDWLREHGLEVPVLIHTYYTEFMEQPAVRAAEAFMEKTGNNVDQLKATVGRILKKRYPQRFSLIEKEKLTIEQIENAVNLDSER